MDHGALRRIELFRTCSESELDALLGGNFTSRLNMNLREAKHWSYGAGTRITQALGQGTFRAGGGVQTDKTAESMIEIRKELREVIGSRKPEAAELKFAKDRRRVITDLKRVSKPGRRVYAGKDRLPRVLGGLGTAIMSTSTGVITQRQAAERGVGGEVIAFVW